MEVDRLTPSTTALGTDFGSLSTSEATTSDIGLYPGARQVNAAELKTEHPMNGEGRMVHSHSQKHLVTALLQETLSGINLGDVIELIASHKLWQRRDVGD